MSWSRTCFGAIGLLTGLSIAVPSAASAQGRGRGHAKAVKAEHKEGKKDDKKDEKRDGAKGGGLAVFVVDRSGHLRVIREYAQAGSLPPGLAKREALPLGLREQLRERGVLPPGLQKRLIPVPGPLLTRMPAVPDYYHRYFVADDLVIIDTRTNRIVSIIRDVWR